jgi:hypothetical protein
MFDDGNLLAGGEGGFVLALFVIAGISSIKRRFYSGGTPE